LLNVAIGGLCYQVVSHLRRFIVRVSRVARHRCQQCGYPRPQAANAICPECGTGG
jgi:rubrerythrin